MGIAKGRIKENKGIHGEWFSLPEEMKVVTPMTEREEPDFDADPFYRLISGLQKRLKRHRQTSHINMTITFME